MHSAAHRGPCVVRHLRHLRHYRHRAEWLHQSASHCVSWHDQSMTQSNDGLRHNDANDWV